tara:strand:+ start:15936 stop:16196 length:261 start_codon:yes stop_codon:yes gene_type:complete
MDCSNINYNNKTILITGGAGFIGSNLAFYFQQKNPQSKIIIFDCFRNEEVLSNDNFEDTFYRYIKLTEAQEKWIPPKVKPIFKKLP